MPATYQGTQFRNGPNPVLHLSPPRRGRRPAAARQARPDPRPERPASPRPVPTTPTWPPGSTPTSWPSACRRRRPQAVDLSEESEQTKEQYGLNRKECADFGRRCLLARRLVERGVRFVQVYCGGGSQWDAHSDLEGNHSKHVRPLRPADRGAA